MVRPLFSLLLAVLSCPVVAFGWDYSGHRAVNLLALSSLPREFPAFALTPASRERIGFLAGEPDRWRNVPDLNLRHANGPDHYLDVEDLAWGDLTLENVPRLRYVFAGQLAVALHQHPERLPKIDPEKNKDRTRELIGFLPWSITENYAKLRSAFSYLKAYREHGGTAEEIANAEANVVYIMGVMGHYVADAAQPLHTTRMHNGWVGANPEGYTTARTFHAWIDGGFLEKTGGVSADALVTRVKPARELPNASVDGSDPVFQAVLAYIADQHALVEPLYRMEKEGKLKAETSQAKEGRAFLERQLLTAGQMLGSLWYTAWRSAPADTYLTGVLTDRKLKQGAGQ